jgi:hypothetical protein
MGGNCVQEKFCIPILSAPTHKPDLLLRNVGMRKYVIPGTSIPITHIGCNDINETVAVFSEFVTSIL